LTHGKVGDDGIVEGSHFAIPYYTARYDDAFAMVRKVRGMGLGTEFNQRLVQLVGSWLHADPDDLCQAALDVVRDSRSQEPSGPNPLAELVALAYREDADPTELLKALQKAVDIATEAQNGEHQATARRDALATSLRRVNKALMLHTRGQASLLDRPEFAVGFLGAQRDMMAETLVGYASAEHQSLKGWSPLDEWKEKYQALLGEFDD